MNNEQQFLERKKSQFLTMEKNVQNKKKTLKTPVSMCMVERAGQRRELLDDLSASPSSIHYSNIFLYIKIQALGAEI